LFYFFLIIYFTKGIQVELGFALAYGDRKGRIDSSRWHVLTLISSPIPRSRDELYLQKIVCSKTERLSARQRVASKILEKTCAIYPLLFDYSGVIWAENAGT
jgi:hypothetical protein